MSKQMCFKMQSINSVTFHAILNENECSSLLECVKAVKIASDDT